MADRIALFRAVNVGGGTKLEMAALRESAVALGLADARTLLQSGNLLFGGGDRSPAGLERALEAACAERHGLSTDVMVRSAEEWRAVLAANPFESEARDDPSHLLIFVLKSPVDAAAVEALQRSIVGPELVRGSGREVYITYPDGIGRSKLTNIVIEKRLGTRGTGRNWNTALKIAAALGVG
jgi:uncharacterized protein (DUF1697 family)